MRLNKHAVLSASSSYRWLGCTPSARLEQEFDDHETEAAAEGTAAHALSEHKLRKVLKIRTKKPISKYDSDEMDMNSIDSLRREGLGYKRIAAIMRFSLDTVKSYCKRHPLTKVASEVRCKQCDALVEQTPHRKRSSSVRTSAVWRGGTRTPK